MILAMEIWLLPAIAALSASYLVSLGWEHFRARSAPGDLVAWFLAALSFIMGGFCAYYRETSLSRSLENNIVTMFVAGAATTYMWLLLRKYFPGQDPSKHQP